MARREGTHRLWIAAGLSPLVHLLGAAGVIGLASAPSSPAADAAGPSDTPPKSPRPDPPREPEVKLGIEKSEHATITWIGFETPTEHEAREADIEQPALTRDAPSSPVQTPETHTEPRPTPEQAVAAAEPVRVPEPVQSERTAATSAENAREVTEPSPILPLSEGESPARAAAERVLALAAAVARTVEEAEQRRAEVKEAAESPPQPRPAEGAAPQTATTPPSEQPREGEISPKESDPTSTRKPVVVRPGRPAASEGLEIETRHLRLGLYGAVKAMPSRLKVYATFDRTGRVTEVEWVRRTGVPELDEPVLDCVYSWRAKGKALEELPKDDPKAGVRVPFELVIR